MPLKVSLITICHNSIDSIESCLESIGNQTYQDIEHIVVDGLSSDGTIDFLKSVEDRISVLEIGQDTGIYDALNKGISHVTGDIVGIVHSNDVLSDNFSIENIVSCFENSPKADMVVANTYFFNPDTGNIVRLYNSSNFRPRMMRFGFMPAHTATFIRKKVFVQYGAYNAKYTSAGDFDFFVRLFLIHKVPYVFLDKMVVGMSTGGMSTSGFFSYWRTSAEILHILKNSQIKSNWLFVLSRLPIKAFKNKLSMFFLD